jgi:YD repeat-containing protein
VSWTSLSHSKLQVLSAGLIVILSASLSAQVPDPVTAAEAPVPGAGHHYIGIGAETVNPADGSLSFDLPFQPAAARELSFSFGIRFAGNEQFYLSNGLTNTPNLTWTPNWYPAGSAPWQLNGWSYDLPILTAQASVYQQIYIPTSCPNGVCQYQLNQCYGVQDYVFRGLDGTQHTLPIGSIRALSSNNVPAYCPQPAGGTFSPGNDGHGVVGAMQGTTLAPPVNVVDPSGTSYQFPSRPDNTFASTPWIQPSLFGFLASSITDRNGNQITLNANGLGYKDTLGRQAVTWTGIGHSGDQIGVAGLGGNITLQWISTPVSFPETGQNVGGSGTCSIPAQSATSLSVISEIDLPNGQKYSFLYDGIYGRVSKITFPDGGYVRYIWGLNQLAKATHAMWTIPPGSGFQPQEFDCWFAYDVPAIADRYVSFDGQNEVLHQHFVYSTVSNGVTWTSKETTVTSTDLLTTQSTKTKYTYGYGTADAVAFGNRGSQGNQIPIETSVVYQNGTGTTTFKTVSKTWKSVRALLGEQTILDNGQGTATQRCYDANEQVTNLYEYGFQSEGTKPADPSCYSTAVQVGVLTNTAIGPLRRQTTTTYHPFFQWNSGSPTGTHIVNTPDSVTVADGSGTTAKQTTFTYTNSTSASGAVTSLVIPPGSDRANIASVSRLATTGSSVTNTYTWYDTGQLQSMTDPCGNATCPDQTIVAGANHTTTYSYADSYASGTGTPPGQTNAFLTLVTLPNTGVAHTRTFTWGYSDSQLRTSTDENSKSTIFKYADPGLLGRLTEIDYPDTGLTTVAYNDSTFNATNNTPGFTVTKAIASGVNLVSTTAFDGLGHKVRNLLTSDPDGADTTDTTYDGNGRVWKQSNPHRAASAPTDGVTTDTFDSLGRITSILQPDGSTVTTSYTGDCTTVTDEAGKARRSCTDGLGRLTQVFEDPNSSNYETDYQYDTLGNLICAVQKATDTTALTTCAAASATWRPRSFQYDLLARLLTAANSESGTITYTYDANGNVSTKVSPKPDPGNTGTVTTTYTYDTLDRLNKKAYAGLTTPNTPIAQYGYDGTGLAGCTVTPPTITSPTNRVGRMSSECSGPSSSSFSYNPMGVSSSSRAPTKIRRP